MNVEAFVTMKLKDLAESLFLELRRRPEALPRHLLSQRRNTCLFGIHSIQMSGCRVVQPVWLLITVSGNTSFLPGAGRQRGRDLELRRAGTGWPPSCRRLGVEGG